MQRLKDSNKNILISPSIIATDLTAISQLMTSDLTGVDLWHIDVMDGHFVPNITFGPGYIKDLQKHTDIKLDCHLMIEKPENSIQEYIDLAPWGITIHYESTKFPIRILKQIKEAGLVAGISLNPATPVDVLQDILPYVDMVLIMSVDPGFYGQSYMPEAERRIKKVREMLDEVGLCEKVAIQVDGGINPDNIEKVYHAGASIIVAGGSAFKNGKLVENIEALRDKVKK